MFRSKNLYMLALSLGLAGLVLTLTLGLVGAAGNWQAVGVDGGRIYQLAVAETNPTTLYARGSELLWA